MLGNFTTTLLPNLYPIILQDSLLLLACGHKHSKNSADPDQLASQKPVDQDLCCFQKRIYIQFGMVWVNCMVFFFSDSLFLINYRHSLVQSDLCLMYIGMGIKG